ncbi:unnamed protein product [Echinostoma caproni]|uniref:G_PROTEIN_RECEP_F2_4 domain-containing protein n=1 Tax=Echinostoma caproni TaxID=27848 RepID=A0A183AI97_9TREM|nr:unnamed protein product [Echinostoma caproni]
MNQTVSLAHILVKIVLLVSLVHGELLFNNQKSDQGRTNPVGLIASNWTECWQNKSDCFCDAQCHSNGDCCTPAKERLTHLPEPFPYSCVHTSRTFADDDDLEKYGHWFQAIATCPQTSSSELMERCERSVTRKMSFLDVPRRVYSQRKEEENQLIAIQLTSSSFRIRKADVRSMSPVVARLTGRVYANVDCAYCHGEVLISPNATMGEIVTSAQTINAFPVQIRCRTYSFGDRLCYATTYLPRAFQRPCENVSISNYEEDKTQPIFSLTTFKWHEFLVLPDLTLSAEDKHTDSDRPVSSLDPRTELAMDISQLVLCIMSALSLLLLVIIYIVTAELRTHASGQLTIGLSMALFGLLSTFLFTLVLPHLLWTGPATDQTNHLICMTFAVLMHYFFLASFLWMAAFGVTLLYTFGGVRITLNLIAGCFKSCLRKNDSTQMNIFKETILQHPSTQRSTGYRSFLRRAIIPTCLPLIIVIPAAIINEQYFMDECAQPGLATARSSSDDPCTAGLRFLHPGFCPLNDPTRVWFTNRIGALTWFLIPTVVLLGFSSLISAIIGVQIWQMSKMPQFQEPKLTEKNADGSALVNSRRKKLITFTRICAHLSTILGAVWLVQLMANVIPGVPLLYYFTGLLSTGQGLLVALLSFTNPKARRKLRQLTSYLSTESSSFRGTRSTRSRPNVTSI